MRRDQVPSVWLSYTVGRSGTRRQPIAATDRAVARAIATQTHLLAIAPPGCGKTYLLGRRAKGLIPQLQPGQKILALTFTNRAAANLRQHLLHELGRQTYTRNVVVRTFHGHATDIMREHGPKIGIDMSNTALPTANTVARRLRLASRDYYARERAERTLRAVKRNPITDAEVLIALDAFPLAAKIELERQGRAELHYEDLLRQAQRLLHCDDVAGSYQRRFAAVLVDEFQDLTPQHLDIALRTCTSSRTFVGDPDQAIYSWAGAKPAQIEREIRELCGEAIYLNRSFRSSPAVLAMVDQPSRILGARAPLQSARPEEWEDFGGFAGAQVFDTQEDEAEVIKAAKVLLGDGSVSIAVISPTRRRRAVIDSKIQSSPEIVCKNWDLSVDDPTVLQQIRRAVRALPSTIILDEARQHCIDRIAGNRDVHEQICAIFEMAAHAGDVPVSAALERISTRGTEPVGPGVHLLTAHKSKGLEFDYVFVVGLEEGTLPRYCGTDAERGEEARVLVVMLSRARTGVIVTRSKVVDKTRVSASRWWTDLADVATWSCPVRDSVPAAA